MDLAMVAQPPDRLRLRAWKLGRAIFDLTLTREGVWMVWPEDQSLREKAAGAGVGAKQIARQWAALSGDFFRRDDLRVLRAHGSLIFSAPADGMMIRCQVFERSLVPWCYMLEDDNRRVRFTLQLSDYRMIDGIAYPYRLAATSEQGFIDIKLDEVELNADLAAAAFIPPKRAQKLP
jgi:hypothetical protein